MVEPLPLNQLAAELGLGHHEHVAIVGGGGKTTLLHALGRQLSGLVVLTCTTKMGAGQHRGLPVLFDPTIDEVRAAGAKNGSPCMAWSRTEGNKAIGVKSERCDDWFVAVDHVVVEADGSKQRPFKAPAGFEPVVPVTTTMMVSVIGADALGRVIADQCHRPLRVAALAQCGAYERLTPAAAATVLLHERGARKELPTGAAFSIVVTKINAASSPFVDELMAELHRRQPTVLAITVGPPS